tara:strand:- start:303 stop:545 length:243 start_codon:yes stop_codon:yes gene_type:complete
MILTAGAQVIEHVLIRSVLYAVEGALSLTWSGAKMVYHVVVPENKDNEAKQQNVNIEDMQNEIVELRYELASIKEKMKKD